MSLVNFSQLYVFAVTWLPYKLSSASITWVWNYSHVVPFYYLTSFPSFSFISPSLFFSIRTRPKFLTALLHGLSWIVINENQGLNYLAKRYLPVFNDAVALVTHFMICTGPSRHMFVKHLLIHWKSISWKFSDFQAPVMNLFKWDGKSIKTLRLPRRLKCSWANQKIERYKNKMLIQPTIRLLQFIVKILHPRKTLTLTSSWYPWVQKYTVVYTGGASTVSLTFRVFKYGCWLTRQLRIVTHFLLSWRLWRWNWWLKPTVSWSLKTRYMRKNFPWIFIYRN